MTDVFSGIKIPDSKIAREAAELVRQHETEMLYNHSVRVFVFGAMKGVRQNLKFDSELLYVAALFHDLGLVDAYHTDTKRFEVGAPTPRGNFSEAMASPSRKRIWFGKPSRSIPRPVSPNTCDPKSRSQTRAFWWTSSGLDMTSTRWNNATRSSPPFRAVISKMSLFKCRRARP
jgi:hypothetical protein